MELPHRLLVQMSGAPGSGKSTTAKLLAKAIDAIIIDHDVLKTFFLDIDTPFGQAGKNAYRLQATLVEELLDQGKSVIIDSTVNYQNTLDVGINLAKKYDYSYKYIECKVGVDDLDLLDDRLRARVPLRSQRTAVNNPPGDSTAMGQGVDYHGLFKKWIEEPCRPEIGNANTSSIIVYSSISSPEECLKSILEQIQPS